MQVRYNPVIGARQPLPPVQRSGLDVGQAFVDLREDIGGGHASLRTGRQMIVLRTLLLQPREGSNIKVSFDGVRAFWVSPRGLRADVFATRVVQPRPGTFDDGSSGGDRLWGANLSTVDGVVEPTRPGLDLYYIGLRRRAARFATTTADEVRHSVGARWVGRARNWEWAVEGTYQFGRYGGDRIAAYTMIGRLGRALPLPGRPRLILSADTTSGDRRPGDGRLNTFEVPFPLQQYLVQAAFVGPANTIDLHPFVVLTPVRRVTASLGYLALWKASRADAFYLPGPRPLPGSLTTGRFQQHILQLDARWQINDRLSIEGGYARGQPAAGLRAVGARATDFGLLTTTARF